MPQELSLALPRVILQDIASLFSKQKIQKKESVSQGGCKCIKQKWTGKLQFEEENRSCEISVDGTEASEMISFNILMVEPFNNILNNTLNAKLCLTGVQLVSANAVDKAVVCHMCGSVMSPCSAEFRASDKSPTKSDVKRPRGRPRKTCTSSEKQQYAGAEVKDDASPSNGNEEACYTACQTNYTSSCGNSPTKRYSLRGVKLSDEIMKAEKENLGIIQSSDNDVTSVLASQAIKLDLEYPDKSDKTTDCDDICPTESSSSNFKSCISENDVGKDKPSNESINKEIPCTGNKETEINCGSSALIDCQSDSQVGQKKTVEFENVETTTEAKNDKDYITDETTSEAKNDKDYIPYQCMKIYGEAKRRKTMKLNDSQVPHLEGGNLSQTFKIKGSKIKACKYCNKLFVDYIGVEKHVRNFHKQRKDVDDYLDQLKQLQICKCLECGKLCENKFVLKAHQENVHTKVKDGFSCSQCGSKLKNHQSLRNHMRSVHKSLDESHLCHLCPAKYKSKWTLQQHMEEIHEKKSDVRCKICNKTFARKNQLNRHMVSHGVDKSKRLDCPECGKSFWFPYNLQRHIQSMHGPHEERYHCSYCGKGFNLKSGMVTHVQQVHFNIYPYTCPVEGCKGGFSREKLLADHIAQTHPEVQYKVRNKPRSRYKYWKSTEDLFYCSHCSDSFCYKAKLVEHMHTAHSDAFPFKCDTCSQGFLEKSFLTYHQRKAHNQEVEDDPDDNITPSEKSDVVVRMTNMVSIAPKKSIAPLTSTAEGEVSLTVLMTSEDGNEGQEGGEENCRIVTVMECDSESPTTAQVKESQDQVYMEICILAKCVTAS